MEEWKRKQPKIRISGKSRTHVIDHMGGLRILMMMTITVTSCNRSISKDHFGSLLNKDKMVWSPPIHIKITSTLNRKNSISRIRKTVVEKFKKKIIFKQKIKNKLVHQ